MEKEAGRSRKEKALATKTRLYAAADALFTQYGFDEVSVDRIVEEAGVAKGTFYVHFESRDSLLETLISDFVERVDVDYQAFIDTFPPDMPAADMLLRLVEKIMDVILNTIGLARMKALYRAQLANLSHARTAVSYNRMLYKTIMEVLAKGMRRGEFSAELALESLANHLILAMRGIIYEWCIRYPDLDLQAQSQAHFRIILRGMQG
ncbi:MAG: TetR/AcrR family transcriptional regulator [Candidatus Pelethousia sp.]|nr:TetR/AcrR family transcriptional regulator [Candidatus Pelethousia sp.]